MTKVQRPKLLQETKFSWNRTGQLVVIQIELPDLLQIAKFHRNLAAQLIVAEKNVLKCGQSANFGRDGPAQTIIGDIDMFNRRQIPKRSWNRTGKLVFLQGQCFEL